MLEHAMSHGAQFFTREFVIEQGKSPVELAVIVRVVDGKELFYPLYREMPPDRRIGFAMMARICNELRIPEPDGWPTVL